MRLYTSIFLSSLLLVGTAVKAQSFESPLLVSAESNSVKKIVAVQSDNQKVQANNENDVSPERGSGR
jgi:hypothetical protein